MNYLYIRPAPINLPLRGGLPRLQPLSQASSFEIFENCRARREIDEGQMFWMRLRRYSFGLLGWLLDRRSTDWFDL